MRWGTRAKVHRIAPMTTRTRLTLFAPGTVQLIDDFSAAETPTTLEVLAGRGRFTHRASVVACRSMRLWQENLLNTLHVDPRAHACAPLSALGAGVNLRGGSWAEATFVHLAAGLDHLVLVPLRDEQTLDAHDRSALAAHIREDIEAAGLEWIATEHHDFVRGDVLDVQTCDLDGAARMPLTDAMPRGKDAVRLRRLMTEVQMRLHEHPINNARVHRGLLPANAVWLWGAGSAPTIVPQRQWPVLFANDAFTQGLCKAAGQPCRALPDDLREFAQVTEAIAVVSRTSVTELERRWVLPLATMVRSSAIAELSLNLDDVRIDVDTRFKYRFWRKPLRFGAWVNAQ